MTIFSAIGKAMALWNQHGDKIERTLDIWLEDTAPAKPAEAADELRKAVGVKPMTAEERARFDEEQAWMNRTR